MASIVRRREFLAGSAALAGAAIGGGYTCVEVTSAAPIEVPVIEKLSIRVLVDSTHNLFLRPAIVNAGMPSVRSMMSCRTLAGMGLLPTTRSIMASISRCVSRLSVRAVT